MAEAIKRISNKLLSVIIFPQSTYPITERERERRVSIEMQQQQRE
jgi:hypothetical protein